MLIKKNLIENTVAITMSRCQENVEMSQITEMSKHVEDSSTCRDGQPDHDVTRLIDISI